MENNENKTPKKLYKRWWFITLIIIIFLILIGSSSEPTPSQKQTNSDLDPTQNEQPNSPAPEQDQSDIPREYKSALSKADSYANTMHMSKKGVYDQLTSEYGEKFTAEAAQYAIDNVKADWNANALEKAKSYQNTMNMSPAAIRDQLVSEYGEKFTASEADYAIQNIDK